MKKFINTFYRGWLIYPKDSDKHWSCLKGSVTVFISFVIMGILCTFVQPLELTWWKAIGCMYLIISFFFVSPKKLE